MRPLSRWLSSCGSLLALAALFLVVPRRPLLARLVDAVRLSLGPGPRQPAGAAPASTLPVVRAPGHAALVPVDRQCRTGRRGRAHAGAFRPQVPAGSAVRQQPTGGGLAHLPLALGLGGATLLCCCSGAARSAPAALCPALPAAFLAAHVGLQYLRPSDADHGSSTTCRTLLASALSSGQLAVEDGSPATVRTPAGRRRAQPATFPERRCWPAEDARATS